MERLYNTFSKFFSWAAACLVSEQAALHGQRINIAVLLATARGLRFIQQTGVPVTPSFHFLDQQRVPAVESGAFPSPSLHLWMMLVALLAVDQDTPYCVHLAVLAQQMSATELRRRDIPDTHVAETDRML